MTVNTSLVPRLGMRLDEHCLVLVATIKTGIWYIYSSTVALARQNRILQVWVQLRHYSG